MGEWGFPLTTMDLRLLIKTYLDDQGRESLFPDNMPGRDYVAGFMKRHPQLSVRTANLIKRSRGAVSLEQIDEFFDNFEKSAEGVLPCNMWNYDETNLRDDPGKFKAIFRRGVKYAEQVRDHSKSSTSVMFCGSAAGELLPPYVVYKGKNCYESWCQGGPKGAKYVSSLSGWFDTFCFTDWFHMWLNHVRRMPGKKLLLGDNLSSHLSIEVINICRENNIQFVCLPANSTDKMQPLDVAFFSVMKRAWRKQLTAYSQGDPAAKLLQKTEFPR